MIDQPLLILITGSSFAGKSTLAELLKEYIDDNE